VSDAHGRPLSWKTGTDDPILGTSLTVTMGSSRRIVIRYASAEGSPALQWLEPSQTAGKRHPYLFTQGETIFNRTWIPMQDSPGLRQSWSARVNVPAPLRALMSAESLTAQGRVLPGGRLEFRFRMNEPVPAYLIAFAVGGLAFCATGPRTGVYTEPAMLDSVATELVDLEEMMQAAEAIYGPYRWGRYDVLIMPPSFPLGGMESPRLTFATPTILAGDRSLVTVVAHEVAHSWSGNLVTNATWEDFWLNEGFTDYFENRIMERLKGADYATMIAELRWTNWERTIASHDGAGSPDNRLHLNLAGRDPELAINDVAYGKGATFLHVIERAVGRARFDAYLRSRFDRFAFQSQTTSGFLADVREHLLKGDAAAERAIDLDRWAYASGIPQNAVHPHFEGFVAVDEAARAFSAGASATSLSAKGWVTQQWVRFLGDFTTLSATRLDDLDRTFAFSKSGNADIRSAFLQLAVANCYEAAVPSLEEFLLSQGRKRFVVRLFSGLMKQGEWGEPIARGIYARARPGYHELTRTRVEALLK
jgi:aminopeptidase N